MDPQGKELRDAIRNLDDYSTRYFTGHCTGQEQYAVLKEKLGNRIDYLHTGTVISL
jgi:7,8-dihydropterin-6-yl-methyl-4-(beta-D-ribofuranosyl)aminobenzene 5'-phosphate synthase